MSRRCARRFSRSAHSCGFPVGLGSSCISPLRSRRNLVLFRTLGSGGHTPARRAGGRGVFLLGWIVGATRSSAGERAQASLRPRTRSQRSAAGGSGYALYYTTGALHEVASGRTSGWERARFLRHSRTGGGSVPDAKRCAWQPLALAHGVLSCGSLAVQRCGRHIDECERRRPAAGPTPKGGPIDRCR